MEQTKLSAVMSFKYELLSEEKEIEVKLSTSLALSLGFEFSVSFGLDFGMEDSKIFIDAYGEASRTISGEVYTFLGQKPVVTRAKKSIAGFKVREGQAIGCKVTLRGDNIDRDRKSVV